MKIQFPLKHMEDNLIFNKNHTVWAYYRIEGFNYDFLDFDQKKSPFYKQFALFNNAGLDMHLLVIPSPTDVRAIIDSTIEEMKLKDYPLKENGISYFQQVKDVLEKRSLVNETSEYYYYIGIQLNPNKNTYISANPLIETMKLAKDFFNGLNSYVYTATGLEPHDILKSDIESYKKQAKNFESTLGDAFNSRVFKAKTEELVYIIEKMFSTRNNNSDVEIKKDFKTGRTVVGVDDKNKEHEAIRGNDKDFFDVQSTNLEPFNAKTIKLSKINEEDDIEELLTQHFVISHLENLNFHPGFEWIYHIQLMLDFPVTISIRVDHMPNEIIKKKLVNAKLEVDDQAKEAFRGGNRADSTVTEASGGIVQMENYFQQTGYPAHVVNFVLKITGENEEQLKLRANKLKNEMSKFGIRVVAPYGEQFEMFYEMLPGSNKINDDYKQEVDSGLLAGLMFGTSSNIGDNRGFYIGHTKKFNKPVFVQPDLAAKAFDGLGNVVDSLAMLVAGMTGKGKSFFMNIFIFLSSLMGSIGLIIDPKGDRKNWVNGLPYIGKEHIEVWTLGSDENDAGSLDPFRTSVSLEEGKELTIDILAYLTNTRIEDAGYGILSQAVEEVAKTSDPCIGAVIDLLTDWYNSSEESISAKRFEALESLQNTLRSLQGNRLSSLLFGKVGQNFKVLKHDKTIQVLMIQNLNLPSEETKKLLPSHMISEAIMISVTAWTKQYMYKGDRSVHKFILQDEASAIERSPMGKQLMDFIVRQGRYYNTTLLKGSQNASDHDSDVANMGMKFSFALRKTEEAEEMLDYLNLPVTEVNINKLKNLDRGEALFQDIYGRTSEIYIDPVFKDLLNAFDSSTSTEEEREREKNRRL